MVFVPEGQSDRSQARSALDHQKNSPVPEGRLKSLSVQRCHSGQSTILDSGCIFEPSLVLGCFGFRIHTL
jgi:hypothetical protein